MLGSFGLKLLLAIINLLPKFELTPENFAMVDNVDTVLNYFAWANFFIPTNTIVSLLGLTALFYVFKFGVRVYKAVRDFI